MGRKAALAKTKRVGWGNGGKHDADSPLQRVRVDQIQERSRRLVRRLVTGDGERPAVRRKGKCLHQSVAGLVAEPVLADLFAAGGVEDRDPTARVADCQQPAVGADRHPVDLGVPGKPSEHAERGRWAVHEHGEQVAAGVDRVIERNSGAGEPQRLVGAVLVECLSPKPLGSLDSGRISSALAL